MSQTSPSQSQSSWRVTAIAAAVSVATLILLLATESQIGLTWDEPDYIVAARSYSAWFVELLRDPGSALSPESIDAYWTINHEHPPVNKIWNGAVWRVARGLLRREQWPDLTLHRLGNMLLNSIAVGLLYLLVTDVYGAWAGLAASAALLAMPRVFFHLHLASLDVAAASMIVITLVLFWKTRWNGAPWIDFGLGLVWGLAVGTKINAVFVLPTLVVWALLFDRDPQGGLRPRTFVRLAVMGAVAAALFFGSWPWLYHDTLARTDAYIKWITVDHWEIGQWYLDRFWMPPPWHFVFAITAVVVPPAILACFTVGSGRSLARRTERAFGGFTLLNALAPMLALAIGQSMVYDNDRLFMPAMPFFAALAGVGLFTLARAVLNWLKNAGRRSVARALVGGALAALVLAPSLIAIAQLYPHLLSYYSGLVGGVSGATRLGFESTYWCDTYNETLDTLNARAQPGDVVWIDPWSHNVMIYYQLSGQLREDLRWTGPDEIVSLWAPEIITVEMDFYEADWVVYQHRQTNLHEQGRQHPIVRWMELRSPAYEFRYRGTPLISVYKNGRL